MAFQMVRESKSLNATPEADSAGWLTRLGLAPSDNPFDTDSITHQLGGAMRSWPMSIFSLIAGIVPTLWFGGSGWLFIATSAGSIVMLVVGWMLSKSARITALKPHIRTRILAAFAAATGVLLPGVIAEATRTQDMLLSMVALAGTCTITAICFSRMPAIVLSFIGALAISMCLFSGSLPLFAILAVQLFCGITVISTMARAEFAAARRRAQAEMDAVRSSRLLSEFEQSGPGWFWETDRQGLISYISPKVANWLSVKPEQLIGQPLASIVFDAALQQEDAPLGERTLAFYVSTRTAFADLAVHAASHTEERWWSISGRPVVDKYGQFRGFAGSGSDLTEQRRSEAEVSRLARFDPLTGLANRSETGKLLKQAMSSPNGSVRAVGLMLIDLDRFKSVNDTMGHPAGDALLKQVSERLLNAAGRVGQVGRLGGDEFKIVFPGLADARQLAAIADGIISSISRAYTIDDTPVMIGASIGIAISPHDGASPEDLVRNADLALYAAKEAGRGVHRFYEKGMHSAAEQRREIENDMRRALAEGEFYLVYQPLVSTRDEQIIGYESLIRWQHPIHGLISPSKFIPIAEECGMIEQIGEWVLRTATMEAGRWTGSARVAVNVSAIQFANPKLPDLVAQALVQSGLPPERLELEITEGVFVADNAATDRQFETLKSLGIRLALDDFGTGYSSLGYLKRAPFDKIKIDQSFVRGAALGQTRNLAIIKSIVTLADALDMETTAEGVETQDQIELIRGLGCSHIQGFVYGKPMDVAALHHKMGGGGLAERVGHKTSRGPRYRVLRTGELMVEGVSHHVRLRNISAGGATVEFNGWVAIGAQYRLCITDGPVVAGEIRWVKEGKLGLAFNAPLDLRLLATPLAKTG
jgi:diguanylate cyclase (GGDEF)-like protein/PAS domain S-box-containing protein